MSTQQDINDRILAHLGTISTSEKDKALMYIIQDMCQDEDYDTEEQELTADKEISGADFVEGVSDTLTQVLYIEDLLK